MYANKFDADVVAVRRATQHITHGQEKRIADKVFNATNFTNHDVDNEWNDAANRTPIADVETAKLAVRSACGMVANTLVNSYSTYSDLKQCAEIVDRLIYLFPAST